MVLVRTILLALLLSPTAVAQVQMGIEVSPAGRAVAAGDTAVVKVRVASRARVSNPQIVVESGELEISNAGVSQRSFSFGAKTSRDVTHSFAVKGKVGTFKIKAVVKDSAGSSYESETATVRFRARTAAERARDPDLLLRLPKTSAYVGEPLVAQVLIVAKPETGFRHEPGNRPSVDGDGFTSLIVGEPRLGPVIDGNETVEFTARVTPLKPGALALNVSFEPLFAVRTSTGRVKSRYYSIKAEPASLEVKDLPNEGRPADFTGAVGSFQLTIGADPLELEAGEPISLRMSVSGHGNFDLLTPPQPTDSEGWKFYKASRLDLQAGTNGGPSRLEFAQNIVPQAGIAEIPSFKLPVFDPEKETYKTLLTAPIPIKVSGGGGVATPAAVENSVANSAPVASVGQPVGEMTDILLTAAHARPTWATAGNPSWRRPSFWWLQAALVVALIGAAIVARIWQGRAGPPTAAGFSDLLKALDRAPDQAGPFYSAAKLCIDAWQRDGRELPGNNPALQEIAANCGYLQFAGNKSAAADSVTTDKRREVIDALRSLGA